jgi:uridine kinase
MLVIGIAGGSGSGISTFAKRLLEASEGLATLLHLDCYYLPQLPASAHLDGNPNYDHPDAFDWSLMIDHIDSLKSMQSIRMPCYDYKTNRRLDEFTVIHPTQVLIIEGIFSLFNSSLRELLDIKCYMHVDSDIRFTRRLHRDLYERGRTVESISKQYYDTVRPMHIEFLEPQRRYADLIIGENTDVAIRVLNSTIQNYLTTQTRSSENIC